MRVLFPADATLSLLRCPGVFERLALQAVLCSALTFAGAVQAKEPAAKCPEVANRSDKLAIRAAARCASQFHKLPSYLVETVIEVESRFNADAKGGDGEIGLMQVMPATADYLGFKGSLEQLSDPVTNIRFGSRYLATAYKLSGGDLCTTLMKYRAGHGETRFSHLSVEYCRRARKILSRQGIPIQGILPKATFGRKANGKSPRRSGCIRWTLVPGRNYGKCLLFKTSKKAQKIAATRRRIFD